MVRRLAVVPLPRRWDRGARARRPVRCRGRRRALRRCRSGCREAARRRCSELGVWSQPPQRGRPVRREWVPGAVRPQIEQARTGRGQQLGHSGPSEVRFCTRRRLPQLMQTSMFAGSVTRQFGHSGRPWASRVAGSRRAPQRTHSSMRDLAMQLRQTRCPSSGLSMRTTRWQRGQAGRTIPATPASCSRSISRRTARWGARWPSPVSKAGLPSKAQASFCWSAGPWHAFGGLHRQSGAGLRPGPVGDHARERPRGHHGRRCRGTSRIVAGPTGHGRRCGGSFRKPRKQRLRVRRLRSTSPGRGVGGFAAVCRTRRRPVARSPGRRPCGGR